MKLVARLVQPLVPACASASRHTWACGDGLMMINGPGKGTEQGITWALPPTVVSLCSSVCMQMSFLLHNLTLIYSGNIYIYTICYSLLTLVYTILDERVTMTNKLCSLVPNHFLLYFVALAKLLRY